MQLRAEKYMRKNNIHGAERLEYAKLYRATPSAGVMIRVGDLCVCGTHVGILLEQVRAAVWLTGLYMTAHGTTRPYISKRLMHGVCLSASAQNSWITTSRSARPLHLTRLDCLAAAHGAASIIIHT